MAQLPLISSLNHLALEVVDLRQAMDFYTGILGLRELPCPPDAKEGGICWFELPEGRMLHLIENPEATAPKRAHLALVVPDVEAWRTHLSEQGLELVQPKINLYKAERIFVRDPSGNLIEFVRWL